MKLHRPFARSRQSERAVADAQDDGQDEREDDGQDGDDAYDDAQDGPLFRRATLSDGVRRATLFKT